MPLALWAGADGEDERCPVVFLFSRFGLGCACHRRHRRLSCAWRGSGAVSGGAAASALLPPSLVLFISRGKPLLDTVFQGAKRDGGGRSTSRV